MEKFFKVKEHGSTVRVEVLAGITTFMAMSYILMVNAGMFSALPEVSYIHCYSSFSSCWNICNGISC